MDGDVNLETTLEHFVSREALLRLPLAMVLTDPHQDDNPVVYVNDAFERITGYSREMAVGRNCRFLQGPDTDPDAREAIKEAVAKRETATIDIYNYRADGSGFWNRLIIGPLHDDDGELRYFFGIQNDMSDMRDDVRVSRHADRVLREIQHRVKNHLSMIVSMIRMQAKSPDPAASYDALANRVEALQALYQEMTASGIHSIESEMIRTGAYISRIASAIGHLDGRGAVRLNIDCDRAEVDADKAGRLGLLVSEFLTNAFKHAFKDREEGLVELSLKKREDGSLVLKISDDGRGLHPRSEWRSLAGATGDEERATDEALSEGARSGLGVAIAKSLIRSLRAEVAIDSDETGTRIRLALPPGTAS